MDVRAGLRAWFTPFRLFVLAGVVSTAVIGGAGLWASQRSGQAEAIEQVRQSTLVVAKTVVEPNLSSELLAGDPSALADLDALITGRVLDGTTLRVKLWSDDGLIVYSDEPALIGERYELSADHRESMLSGEAFAEISDLGGPENRFEAAVADEMLEVYFPLTSPSGESVLYESYFDIAGVDASADRIRSELAPIILGALLVSLLAHSAYAAVMTRRLRRDEQGREQLLRRAIEASDLERRRIADDLDAGVVRNLIDASIAVSHAADKAKENAHDLAGELRAANASTQRSVHALRALLVDVYPPNLHKQGLESALHDLLAPGAALGIATEVSFSTELVSPEKTALVFRVIQETVRNVFRHSQATELRIDFEDRVEGEETWTVATIRDNGTGLYATDPAGDAHLGLRLLSDLTREAGARFAVDSRPGSGTTIRVEVPTVAV